MGHCELWQHKETCMSEVHEDKPHPEIEQTKDHVFWNRNDEDPGLRIHIA